MTEELSTPATDTLVIDEVELERLERDFADAADALEAIERICATDAGGAERAVAIRQLLDGGRFDLTPAEPTLLDLVAEHDRAAMAQISDPMTDPTTEPSPEAPSDLVGHGDVDATEQVDAVAEAPVAAVVDDPSAAEVGEPLEGSAERALDLVDEPTVGHDHDVEGPSPVESGLVEPGRVEPGLAATTEPVEIDVAAFLAAVDETGHDPAEGVEGPLA